jgi:hypothetical protein
MVKFLHENSCQFPFVNHQQLKNIFNVLVIGETDSLSAPRLQYFTILDSLIFKFKYLCPKKYRYPLVAEGESKFEL